MLTAIHNINPVNDNRDRRFAEMKQDVGKMSRAAEELLKPGVIDGIVNKALGPVVAELAAQMQERVVVNRTPTLKEKAIEHAKNSRFQIPKAPEGE